jgi:hypothetical protein
LKISIKGFLKILPILLIILVGVCFLVVQEILAHSPKAAEWYAIHIFPIVSLPAVFLSSLFPISLTEFVLIAGLMTLPLLLVWFIFRAVCSKKKGKFFYRTALIVAITFSLLTGSFSLMHGINYSRKPLDETLDIVPAERSTEELAEVMRWLIAAIAEEQNNLSIDEAGCTMLLTDMNQTLADGSAALDLASNRFPVLAGNDALPKPVVLSHYWSYTGIVGMYFPFFGEANINIDVPVYSIPMSICHELAHIRGIAREQDANLAAFIACISSDRADFRYSGYIFALGYIAGDLAAADLETYYELMETIPETVWKDWQSDGEYWTQFEGPVEEVSSQVNDTYLKANNQDAGIVSYSMVSGQIIEYYFKNEAGTKE